MGVARARHRGNRLDRDTSYARFVAGLERAIEPAKEPYTTTSIEWHLFEDLTYDLQHTLPFVCDQVLTYPRDTAIMIVAARSEFVRRFAAAWSAMGFTGPLLVPQECTWIDADIGGITRESRAQSVRKADLFIFEFGRITQGLDEPVRAGRPAAQQDKSVLRRIGTIFRRTAADEVKTRPSRRKLPRRFIGVNVIYNANWHLFTDYVASNINPFCGQVLSGPLRVDPSFTGKVKRMRAHLMA